MDFLKQLTPWLTLLLLLGCSTFSVKPKIPVMTESLIAQNFINTMVQIDRLSPRSTVLQFDANLSSDLFGNALRTAAANNGYAVQTVDRVGGSNYVKFSVSKLTDSAARVVLTYDVSVGDVDFRRAYKSLVDGRVEPHRAMLVRGADVTEIESDDTIFYRKPAPQANAPLMAKWKPTKPTKKAHDGFDSPVARKDKQRRLASELQENKVAVTSPITVSPKFIAQPINNTTGNIQEIAQIAQIAQIDNIVSESAKPAQTQRLSIRKRNVADSGASNYEYLLSEKKNVAERILIFGDDSYVLGARNKKILNEIMSSYNPTTDVISVVGCSTGTSKIANGNAALAIGRANRVKEALLYSGISHEKIYDEGCWSPTANSTPFPNRGVVITVKREAKNG